MNDSYTFLKNGSCVTWDSIPVLTEKEFDRSCLDALKNEHCRLLSYFALPGDGEEYCLIAILGDPEAKKLRVMRTTVAHEFVSLTPEYAGFNRFEREIFETYGIVPVGHPKAAPLRFTSGNIGKMDFFSMKGDAVHEVAVGPVHAGVIEPGHFRFQCMGETVYSLEISLGYQHRGLEKMLVGGPDKRTPHLIETAAGDSSIAAAWNYSGIIEALSGITVPPEAENLRQIALELERCANHIGDLGALAGDVAFLPTASFCGRIRGEYLNMSAELCGNRFGRNFIVPGGCRYSTDAAVTQKLVAWLRRVAPELWNALDLMFNSPTVLDRFENTGSVDKADAFQLGLTGVAGRACGMAIDARYDFPATEKPLPGKIDCENFTGDVLSRAKVRYAELKRSHEYLFSMLDQLSCHIPAAEVTDKPLQGNMLAVHVTEAWRGELCHAAVTGSDGRFRILKIVDPSFHNWEGLVMALRDGEISDFPICNKSFNLSYCGHDL